MKKHRWCAWDSNPGMQETKDWRRTQINSTFATLWIQAPRPLVGLWKSRRFTAKILGWLIEANFNVILAETFQEPIQKLNGLKNEQNLKYGHILNTNIVNLYCRLRRRKVGPCFIKPSLYVHLPIRVIIRKWLSALGFLWVATIS